MSGINFVGKKILFISLQFFNYEKIIIEKIKKLGGEVTYFDERPSNSVFAKGIIRLKRDFFQKLINSYYRKLFKKIKDNKFDYLFLIKGEVVPIFFLEDLKLQMPNMVLVYYTFDSFVNNPNAKNILPFFDRKFTFDSKDANDYNLTFRPLFFSDEYAEIYNNRNGKYDYDVMFVGTAHSDRYLISEEIVNWCNKNNRKSFTFYYSPSKLAFYFMKFFDSSFKKFDYKKISFKSLLHSQIINLNKSSKVVLDINHPGQKGLTMRTFESLGAGKKIITTNEEIIKYPFYNSNNICIIDRKNISLENTFFETDFIKIKDDLYYQMSIDGWLEELFFIDQSKYWQEVLN